MGKIGNPSPVQFQRAASQAESMGGMVRLDKKGNPVAQGGTWRGKAAVWAKERLMPGLARRQNREVLQAFQKSLDSAYSVSSEGTLKEMCSAKLPPSVVASDIRQTAVAYEETAELSVTSVRQTNDFFAGVMSREGAFEEMSRLAGKDPQEMATQADHLKLRYGRFVRQLAKNPLLKDGVIPHVGVGTADALRGMARSYRLEDGRFSDGFLKAAFIVSMENMAVGGSGVMGGAIEDYGVGGDLAAEDLDWLREEYQSAFPEGGRTEEVETPPSRAPAETKEVPTAQLIDI